MSDRDVQPGKAEPAADRRQQRRPVSLPGHMLRAGGLRHMIELIDLNYGGWGIRTPVELTPGEQVKVTVPDRGSIPAEVRWYDGGRAGLDFSPGDPRARDRHARRRPHPRRDRGHLAGPRAAELPGQGHLSIAGCQIEFAERPREGERLSIKFDFLEALDAEVLWVERRTAGLKFENAMHPAVFSLLLERLAP